MARTPAPKRSRPPLGAISDNRTPREAAQKNKKRSAATPLQSGTAKRPKQAQHPMINENDIEALLFPNPAEVLHKIDNQADRNLQVLLWEIDCHYVLLPHQFKGVRAMAGVVDDFPGANPSPPTQEAALLEWVINHLVNAKTRDDRGVLMADVMGLGKTVQCVAACMLRNALALAQGRDKKPTLIVSPNDAVGTQWYETLVRANVAPKAIFRFKAKSQQMPSPKHQFYLCNRYDLQTEARHCFDRLEKTKSTHFAPSPLFPNASKKLLECLQNQYKSEKGEEQNWFKQNQNNRQERKDPMNAAEIITKSLSKYVGHLPTVFETVVIDEAHFLKNLTAYWGMAAGLLGLHTNRMIPMSGTPYNNSCQDVATLMAMIDSRLESANEKWWKRATRASAAKDVQEAIHEWSSNYLIRRDKSVIASQLPKKIIRKKHVGPLPLELSVYEMYESKFLAILSKFQCLERQNLNMFQRQKMKKYFELMLAFASCMRCSLIHPLLAGGGREFTILFSPSRRERKTMLNSQEKPNKCVCCHRNKKKKGKKQASKNNIVGEFEGEFEDDDDDDDNSLVNFIVNDDTVEYMDDDDESTSWDDRKPKATSKKKQKDLMYSDSESEPEEEEDKNNRFGGQYGYGEIVPIPNHICQLADYGIRHFACESCLEGLEGCPICSHAQTRLRLEHGRNELMKMKMEAGKANSSESPENMDVDIPRKLYCQGIFGGFRASAKLESIMEDYHKLPAGDKVLICSFFKGSLDLLEAMFEELKVVTARFDGDISSDEREYELSRFKEEENCRVLLLTVQTGGTGLNLVNANHVWFVDRFWNPMVMEQAEDRCYRLGQKKDVYITYHDVNYTTDDVMRHINDAKSENAKVILADGCQLSTSTAGMSYKDISGQLGDSVRAIQGARVSYVMTHKQHIYQPLPPSPAGVIEAYNRNSEPLNRQTSLLDAIATMLGFSLPPSGQNPFPGQIAGIAAAAAAAATLTTTTSPTPMNIVSSGESKSAVQPDRSTSDGSDGSGGARSAANEDAKEKKPEIFPPQTKSEPGAIPLSADVIDLDDVKPPAMPMPDRKESKPNTGVPGEILSIDTDDDDGDSSAGNKGVTADNKTSRVKAEEQPSSVAANPEVKQSWLDDDSDDDSIPEVVSLLASKKKRGGK